MTDNSKNLEERIEHLEAAIRTLNREQIKDRVKMIGSLEYVVERLNSSDLQWEEIAAIHKEIEESFEEAYEKVKREIREEEKVKHLIDSIFKKKRQEDKS